MKIHITWLSGLLRRMGILLLLYFICRLLFILFNKNLFPSFSPGTFFSFPVAGLVFDLSAIIMLNIPYILLTLLPSRIRQRRHYTLFLQHLFIWPNAAALLLNLTDIGYYPFTLRRSTADIFHFIGHDIDFLSLLPSFLSGYWYLLIVFLLFVWALFYLDKRIIARQDNSTPVKKYFLKHGLILLISLPFFILAYRGGFQLKPIHIADAGNFCQPAFIPIVLNTPFTVMKTIGSGALEEWDSMSGKECRELFDPVHPADTGVFRNKNVVIIILESFSREYSAFFSGNPDYTPFLDSLASTGLAAVNAYANGHRSIEALPAIVTGIPSLMDEPYITSSYAGNDISSLASLLGKKGYSTSFFHGAKNGSMGFESFSRLAGFGKYYGMNEYGKDSDADGHWGIWDRPFFRFFGKKMEEEKQPFFTSIFTLSSHHPFRLPEGESFPEGPHPILKTIRYTDDVLREFFRDNREKSWFRNSLFIITADHTGPDIAAGPSGRTASYRIPIVIWDPSDSLKGKITKVTQQADILCTVLDLLNYDEPHYSFGQSMLDSADGLACWQSNGVYAFVSGSTLYEISRDAYLGEYSPPDDPVNHAGKSDEEKKKKEKALRAFVQRYNHDMIHNRLRVK